MPSTSTKAIEDITHGLGTLLWWDLSGTAIEPTVLRAILRREGGDESIVPDIEPTRAIRDAARLYHQGRGNAHRYRAEVIECDPQVSVTIGVVKRVKRGPQEVGWDQVSRATYTVAHGWEPPTDDIHEMRALLKLARERMTFLDHAWLRPHLIQARLRGWGSFSLRRQGGIYYVPNAFSGEVEKLQRIVTQIGSSAIRVLHVDNTDSSRESISAEARNHLAGSVDALHSKIEEWNDSTGKVRASTLGRALEEFKALRDQAALYADALSMKATDLLDDVSDAEEELKRMIADAGLGSSVTKVGQPRPSTLRKLGEALAAGSQTPEGIVVTKAGFAEVNLGTSRWCKFLWDWHPGTAQQVASATLGYRGAFSADPLQVTFTKIEGTPDGTDATPNEEGVQ